MATPARRRQPFGRTAGAQRAELRARNELYVDKTAYIADMLDGYGKCCFLARPRRFGKSWLVSTLECLFQGRAALFRGTQIEGRTPRSPN